MTDDYRPNNFMSRRELEMRAGRERVLKNAQENQSDLGAKIAEADREREDEEARRAALLAEVPGLTDKGPDGEDVLIIDARQHKAPELTAMPPAPETPVAPVAPAAPETPAKPKRSRAKKEAPAMPVAAPAAPETPATPSATDLSALLDQ